jgi:hypothetical protein
VAEYRRCLADFFAEGVQDGLRLAYVSSDGVEAAGADLADLGDLERLLAVGALHVLWARDMHGADGPVEPERVMAFVATATEQALADGFRGLAVSADATELVALPCSGMCSPAASSWWTATRRIIPCPQCAATGSSWGTTP